MTAGQEEASAGRHQEDKSHVGKCYEAILEEEKLQDIRVQCVDFCETMTSKVHAVLQHAPFDL